MSRIKEKRDEMMKVLNQVSNDEFGVNYVELDEEKQGKVWEIVIDGKEITNDTNEIK